jgi:hypothetical protein
VNNDNTTKRTILQNALSYLKLLNRHGFPVIEREIETATSLPDTFATTTAMLDSAVEYTTRATNHLSGGPLGPLREMHRLLQRAKADDPLHHPRD